MLKNKKYLLEDSFHNQELVNIQGKNFIINELTEQIPATTPELLKHTAERIIKLTNFTNIDKIVGEEEKGGILVAAVSILTNIPFGLARWYPSDLPGQIMVNFSCEYTEGNIYLNGVNKGDRVIIIDDVISTGGTMIALINAIRQAGAEIIDIIVAVDKEEYGGIKRIKEATGLETKSVISVYVTDKKSKVKGYKE